MAVEAMDEPRPRLRPFARIGAAVLEILQVLGEVTLLFLATLRTLVHAPRDRQRIVTQLAPGLMYHFALAVCEGDASVSQGRKHVRPYRTAREYERWFQDNGAEFGIRPMMFSVALRSMRFHHEGVPFRVDHAVLEGALEVTDTESLMRKLLRGFGSHRRLGLGMMKLQS